MKGMKESLPVFAAFLAGLLFGAGGLVPSWLLAPGLPMALLSVLVFLAGVGLGAGDDLPQLLHGFHLRMLLLPLCTVVGSLLFSSAGVWLFAGRGLTDCLAVGSGFGYYSLSSVLIAEMKSATLGADGAAELATVALVANVAREMIALLFLPLFARWGGRLAPISVAGINSMDVCLPMIVRCTGDRQVVPQALLHGVVLEVSVPVLIAAFC